MHMYITGQINICITDYISINTYGKGMMERKIILSFKMLVINKNTILWTFFPKLHVLGLHTIFKKCFTSTYVNIRLGVRKGTEFKNDRIFEVNHHIIPAGPESMIMTSRSTDVQPMKCPAPWTMSSLDLRTPSRTNKLLSGYCEYFVASNMLGIFISMIVLPPFENYLANTEIWPTTVFLSKLDK